MSEPIVRLRGVSKSYTRGKESIEVLQKLDLAVSKGDFLARIGPSGSGQTTLRYLFRGLCLPSAGEKYSTRPSFVQPAGLYPCAIDAWRTRQPWDRA